MLAHVPLTLHMPTDGLASAMAHLPSGWAGQFFEVVESTQDEARAAAAQGAPGGSIFVADFQRAGRGRQGRQWLARPGVALMLSILFREGAGPASVPLRFTTLASVSLAQAIEEVVPALRPAIKWPNDL